MVGHALFPTKRKGFFLFVLASIGHLERISTLLQGGHSLENLENWEKSGNSERPGKNREKSGNL